MRLGRAVAFLVERTGLRDRLQEMWRRDIARSIAAADRHTGKSVATMKRLADKGRQGQCACAVSVRELEHQLAASAAVVRNLESRLTRLERTALADSRQAAIVAEWQSRFGSGTISAHLTRAVADAPLHEEPAAHLFVERIFPPDFCELVVDTVLEVEGFTASQSNEIPLRRADLGVVPRLTALVWEFIDTGVADAIVRAAVERLRPFVQLRYARLFGAGRADAVLALPHEASGRLVRWPRGYGERPHLDPKATSITVLIYLAKPGAAPAAAASLYSIAGDFAPVHADTAYPDAHGVPCAFMSHVPFRHNSALILMNGGIAHRIDVPEDGMPENVAEYAVEFRIGPNPRHLVNLVSTLPAADQQQWLGLAGALTK